MSSVARTVARSVARHLARGVADPYGNGGGVATPVISITSGTGYAGSTYTSTIAGQWYADDVAIGGETGETYVLSLANEGKVIRCGDSNEIEMWVPQDATGTLVALFDIRQGLTLAGAAVSAWASQVGGVSAVQATGVIQPDYGAAAFNGNPGIAFGATDRLNDIAISMSPPSVTVVGGVEFNDANDCNLWGASLANGFEVRRSAAGLVLAVVAAGSAVLATSSSAWTTGVPYLLGVRHQNAGPYSFRRNGVANGSGTSAGSVSGAGTVTLGVRYTSTNYLRGDMTSQLRWHSILSDADMERAEGWVAHTTGNTGLLDAAHPYKTIAPKV